MVDGLKWHHARRGQRERAAIWGKDCLHALVIDENAMKDCESFLELLRIQGIPKSACVLKLVDEFQMSLREAQITVHESAAWADSKARDEEWSDLFISQWLDS